VVEDARTASLAVVAQYMKNKNEKIAVREEVIRKLRNQVVSSSMQRIG
jgi:hypothetical protein